MVLDEAARGVLGRVLQPLVRAADAAGLRPNQLTLLGLLLGLAAALAVALGAWWTGLALWLVGRIPDGLDGLLARHQGAESDHGGFLDVMADFTGYGAFVVGIAVALPEARVACAVLLLAYYLNGSAFLAVAGLAEKQRRQVVEGERSLQFVRGLTEGTETVVAHGVFALLGALRPSAVAPAVWVFAGLVLVTVLQRVRFGWRVLQ